MDTGRDDRVSFGLGLLGEQNGEFAVSGNKSEEFLGHETVLWFSYKPHAQRS